MTTTTATRPRDALARIQPFHDLTVARARGSWYVDTDGHRHLDMLSGCWCSVLGHNHPRFVRGLGLSQAAIPIGVPPIAPTL